MEQTEELAVQRARCMTLETLALVCADPRVSLPAPQLSLTITVRPMTSYPACWKAIAANMRKLNAECGRRNCVHHLIDSPTLDSKANSLDLLPALV
jgi:hypothetical protein